MDDAVIRSKKSSRLNPKKQQKIQLQLDPLWQSISIDVVIQEEQKLAQTPKVLKNYKAYLTEDGNIVTAHLTEQLMNQKLFKQQPSLSFFDEGKQVYVYGFSVPKSPLQLSNPSHPNYVIDSKFLNADNTLKIKIRNKKKLIIQALIEQQREKYQQNEEATSNFNTNPGNKGQKQKKIGEVVEKVALWRKFYTGFYDQSGNYIQKPLQSAAQQVGIAKKTLDDYLLQIRNGKKYGFNFNEKYSCKIGELRAFVRDQKKKQGSK